MTPLLQIPPDCALGASDAVGLFKIVSQFVQVGVALLIEAAKNVLSFIVSDKKIEQEHIMHLHFWSY